ncbi:hypothetical protein ACUN0C_07520 [Faunimonas sp. B44]|uniref:hypothetical protein n=1 Tax=Faunimonas sp. B44 TaxID=3461493 RepID=UPI0040443DFF
MVQLVVLGLAAYGGWYLWKSVKKEIGRVGRDVEKARSTAKPSETLEYDPDTQKYRLKKDS